MPQFHFTFRLSRILLHIVLVVAADLVAIYQK